MKAGRRLSDFELRAELNRMYVAEHGKMPPQGYWLGDQEYLAEVRQAASERQARDHAKRQAKNEADQPRFKQLRAIHDGRGA